MVMEDRGPSHCFTVSDRQTDKMQSDIFMETMTG